MSDEKVRSLLVYMEMAGGSCAADLHRESPRALETLCIFPERFTSLHTMATWINEADHIILFPACLVRNCYLSTTDMYSN